MLAQEKISVYFGGLLEKTAPRVASENTAGILLGFVGE
jgi:hypothetical protein